MATLWSPGALDLTEPLTETSNRDKQNKILWEVEGCGCIRLRISLPYLSRLS
jgi:hypothetical protein